MRDRVRVLCTPAAAAGFRLAGFVPDEIGDPGEGARRLATLIDHPDAGLVLVEDVVHDALTDVERRALARRPLPVVIPFPSPAWTRAPESPEAFIVELLRQAIGYRVKLG
jgi:vacuolar-type H+-ATPase subunit F/Vma7